MNAFRSLPRIAVAVWLTFFAVAAMAGPTKLFGLSTNLDLTNAYSTNQDGLRVLNVPLSFSVTLTNLSPPSTASSNISSFTLTASGMTITNFGQQTCLDQGASSCVLDPNTNTITVTGISPPIQGKGTFTVPVTVNSCGDGTWSAIVWTGSSLNGQPFSGSTLATNVPCGDAGCGAGFSVPTTSAALGSVISGTRGQYNKDGATCPTTDYTATNTIPSNNKLHFEWDANQSGASFRYTVTFLTAGLPQLSWKNDNAGPVFINAEPCLVTQFQPLNLPAPYGTLAQDVNLSKTTIKVNVTTAPTISLPFPIVIGSERMQVTAINNNNNQWTVVRGQGGTSPSSHAASATTFVMSTPRPLIMDRDFSSDPAIKQAQLSANYKVGDQAHGCVASPDAGTYPWTGTSTFVIIDIDDIWSSGR